jgi:adenylate cyclase class IV
MNEIELKARVSDRKKLTDTLNSFACFKGSLVRDDRYFAKKMKTAHSAKKRYASELRLKTIRKPLYSHGNEKNFSRIPTAPR